MKRFIKSLATTIVVGTALIHSSVSHADQAEIY